MRMLVTGANGFLGRAVMAQALARGHEVVGLTRDDTPVETGAGQIVLDLSRDTAADAEALARAVAGCDVVIHTAAALSGDAGTRMRDTKLATRNLLAACGAAHAGTRAGGATQPGQAPAMSGPQSGPPSDPLANHPTFPGSSPASPTLPRLVLISSISVYDADALPEGAMIDEDAPLERQPRSRDGYARSKLTQERMVRDYPGEVWILRPGTIYGPGRMWNAHVGPVLGPVLLCLGNKGQIPLVARDACADAVVRAAETGGGGVVNLVDSALPDRRAFLRACGPGAPPVVIPLSWRIFDLAATLGALIPRLSHRLPGLLRPRPLRARMRPAQYTNSRAQTLLGWRPGRFEDGFAQEKAREKTQEARR